MGGADWPEVGAWLAARSRAYHQDAQRLSRDGGDIDGMAAEDWAIVYRAVSAELNKCAKGMVE